MMKIYKWYFIFVLFLWLSIIISLELLDCKKIILVFVEIIL